MLDIIVIDLVLCILMVEIVEMFVIAKTTPFVTQPTENALVHQDSWVKSRFFSPYFKVLVWIIVEEKVPERLILGTSCTVKKCEDRSKPAFLHFWPYLMIFKSGARRRRCEKF